MGNHSRCGGCGEMDELCVCKKSETRPFFIDHYDSICPQLRMMFGDREISFSVACVEPNSRGWLGSVLERQIRELVEYRVNQALDRHKAELRKQLGVK